MLTSNVTGRPIGDQTIVFGPAACTAVTDSAGTASCTGAPLQITQLLISGSTTARYAGTANYLPSTDTVAIQLF